MSYFEKLRLRELRRGSELLRALKGRKIVAGGNASGMVTANPQRP